MRNGNTLQGSQGALDLFDNIPLTLADDPEIELRDLDALPPIGRMSDDELEATIEAAAVDSVEAVRAMFEGFGWSVTR